jgi:hypothetical protein
MTGSRPVNALPRKEKLQMRKLHARRYVIPAAVLAALGLVFWAGCSKDLVPPDNDPPEGSAITNPVHNSSLNSGTINVRGRAEVGATIKVYVNDDDYQNDPAGTALSSPAVPNDGLGGRFTVEEVDLGDEGVKSIRARITDLYGNEVDRSDTPTVRVTLDQTPPPVAFEGIEGAVWIDTLGFWGDGYWESGLPEVIVSGSTDTSALGARLRFGIDEHGTNEFVTDPATGIVDFTISATCPPLSGGHADTLINYYLEAFDVARNVAAVPLFLHWEIEGREEELSHDDGIYNSFDHWMTGRAGQKIAVRFQAPTWANYVTKIVYYIANDQRPNPSDPEAPSTEPFTAYVWRTTIPDSLPGLPGNDGYVPFSEYAMYPEDEWVSITFPNAVNIMDNSHYPDKTFFVGMQWEHRDNPYIYEDYSDPITFKSFFWDYATWELRQHADTMIRAVVSDVPSLDGKGREVVLIPMGVPR